MAKSTLCRRSPWGFPLTKILIVITFSLCGFTLADASRPVAVRQPPVPSLPACVEACRPDTSELEQFCKQTNNERLFLLTACAREVCDTEAESGQVGILHVTLCEEGITAPSSSIDVGTSILLDTNASTLVPKTTLASTSTSTTSAASSSATPTDNVESSGDSSGTDEGAKENSNGNDLSIPVIVAISVGGTVFLAMCAGLWFVISCMRKRKRREREEHFAGDKGFENSSSSDRGLESKHGIPLGSATRKEIGRGHPWIDEENNNGSTAHLYNKGPMDKPRLAPIATKFAHSAAPKPRGGPGDASAGDVSPVSPVSPLSEYFDDRRSKAISTVSSVKAEGRTHHDFYNVTSPPLPTPSTAIMNRFPSTRIKPPNKPIPLVTAPVAANRPVSPLSRNPSGKSNGGRSEVSAVGEEQFGWESYRDMIRKYEEQQAQGKPIPPEMIERLSGLSQFNFDFGESKSSSNAKKRESSYYGWAPGNNSGGHLGVPSDQNREKHHSGSSSVYSSQPMTPPPPIGREPGPGPSTPEMFLGRPSPSYTPPSPQPARTVGHSFTAVSAPPSQEPPDGLARANSLRWRREVEAATDQALKKIGEPTESNTKTQQKSSGFWSLLTPKLSGASPKVGTVHSGTGSVSEGTWPIMAAQTARSESLVSEDGKTGVVVI